jgi:acyl-coenzyme A synthetase/AMP-(fatty) acid ligase
MTEVAEATSNVASAWIDALIASNRGDRHAFAYAEKRYSYQDVAALMNRTANMLRGAGLQPGARVLVLLPGSPALVASLLGAIKAGAVPIVGVARADAEAAQRCIDATEPAAAIVHKDDLPGLATALASLPASDAVIVVGNNVQGRKSFVEEIRGQSSWSSPEPVGKDAPALGIWAGSALQVMTHGELAARVAGDGSKDDGHRRAIGPMIEMLRAFAHGDTATLP